MALGFYRFDVTKDGLVGQDDAESLGQQVAEQLQLAQGSAQATQIVQAFVKLWEAYAKPADKDGDNVVSFDEFAQAHAAFLQTPNAREQGVGVNAAVFAALDTNGDGRLSLQEYAAFLKPLGVSTSEAETAFRHLDRDGDGFISDEELAEDWWEYWNSEDRSAPGNWFFGSY
jgi:Ca2+-binding EF-hand superfamily protein